MLRNLILIWVILTALLVASKSFGETVLFVGGEYTTTTSVTVKWDASLDAEFYEIRADWIDVSPNVQYNLGRTMETQFEVFFPRSGHFKLFVRAGAWSETSQEELFSEWSDSTDATCSSVNGEPMGWRVVKKLDTPVW